VLKLVRPDGGKKLPNSWKRIGQKSGQNIKKHSFKVQNIKLLLKSKNTYNNPFFKTAI
jgi:hypothetical protein